MIRNIYTHRMSAFLYAITPVAGCLKNYVKYKQCNLQLFLRTPCLYFFIDKILKYYRINQILLWTLILERWCMFHYKILSAYLLDYYHTRQQKYIQKYGLTYPANAKA